MVPRVVLMKSGLVSVKTARQVNAAHTKTTINAARPMSYLSKTAHSTVNMPIHKNTTFKNSNFNHRVNTVKDKNVNTIRPKAVVNAARPKAVVNAVKGNNVNAIKTSACWVWKPKTKVLDHVSKHNSASITLKKFDYGNPQMDLQDQGVIDSGCSRHMTGNMSYLTNYEEIYGGYVAFGGNPKGGKITRKGTQSNGFTDTKASDNSGQARKETEPVKNYILLPLWPADPPYSQDPKSSQDDGSKPSSDDGKKVDEDSRKDGEGIDQEKEDNANSTNNVNASSINEVNVVDDEDVGAEADMHNLDTTIQVSPILTTRIHKDHHLNQVIGDLQSATQTRKMSKNLEEHGKNPKRYKGDILLVQVYVDDIIFGLTKKELCNAFEKFMHEKFQMSSIGELTFFLGLQVQQKKDGIFIIQDKYVDEILKKFRFTKVKTASTPIETQKPLLKDENDKDVDVHIYRSMIGSLMYLTSSRPDIMFAVCAGARYQVNPKVSHLHAVKRIFRYLKSQQKLGFWYPKDSPFDLVAYTDNDYAGASLDRKSTTRGCQFLVCRIISWWCKKQTVVANSTTEAEYVAASSCCGQVFWIQNQLVWNGIGVNAGDSKLLLLGITYYCWLAKTVNGEVQLQALMDGKKIIITESTMRRDLQLEDAEGVDCLPNFTIFEQLTDGATPNEAGSQGTTSGGGPKRQETMGDTTTQTRFESVSKFSNDPLLARGNTLRSGKDSLKLNELMELCTNLQTRVLDLKKTKTTQASEIDSLKRRVKKLEKKKRSRTHGLKRLYKVGLTARVESSGDKESFGEDASKQGRINAIDADEDINLVNDQDDTDMFNVNTLTGDEVLAVPEVTVKDVNLTIDEVTLAQALAALKSVKPKVKANIVEGPSIPVSSASTKVSAATTTTTATIPTPRKGIVITELGTSTKTTTISSQPSHAKVHDKGKGIMVEEPVKSMTKKYLVRLDEEIASKLQTEFDEEERLTREKDEANVALTEE
ncbi:uncharacterized mitochondrial protein-like protein [Tanacetum coccineum]